MHRYRGPSPLTLRGDGTAMLWFAYSETLLQKTPPLSADAHRDDFMKTELECQGH